MVVFNCRISIVFCCVLLTPPFHPPLLLTPSGFVKIARQDICRNIGAHVYYDALWLKTQNKGTGPFLLQNSTDLKCGIEVCETLYSIDRKNRLCVPQRERVRHCFWLCTCTDLRCGTALSGTTYRQRDKAVCTVERETVCL